MVSVLVIAAIAIAIVLYVWRRREHREKLLHIYGEEWRAYNAGAFVTQVQPSDDPRFVLVTRLAPELKSAGGKFAIDVHCDGRQSRAIQQINKNGTFSKRGPHFISIYTGRWYPTGSIHLVRTIRGKKNWGFPSDHYNQQGVIAEKGLSILEYNTRRYPPMDIWQYSARRKKTGPSVAIGH